MAPQVQMGRLSISPESIKSAPTVSQDIYQGISASVDSWLGSNSTEEEGTDDFPEPSDSGDVMSWEEFQQWSRGPANDGGTVGTYKRGWRVCRPCPQCRRMTSLGTHPKEKPELWADL